MLKICFQNSSEGSEQVCHCGSSVSKGARCGKSVRGRILSFIHAFILSCDKRPSGPCSATGLIPILGVWDSVVKSTQSREEAF